MLCQQEGFLSIWHPFGRSPTSSLAFDCPFEVATIDIVVTVVEVLKELFKGLVLVLQNPPILLLLCFVFEKSPRIIVPVFIASV